MWRGSLRPLVADFLLVWVLEWRGVGFHRAQPAMRDLQCSVVLKAEELDMVKLLLVEDVGFLVLSNHTPGSILEVANRAGTVDGTAMFIVETMHPDGQDAHCVVCFGGASSPARAWEWSSVFQGVNSQGLAMPLYWAHAVPGLVSRAVGTSRRFFPAASTWEHRRAIWKHPYRELLDGRQSGGWWCGCGSQNRRCLRSL